MRFVTQTRGDDWHIAVAGASWQRPIGEPLSLTGASAICSVGGIVTVDVLINPEPTISLVARFPAADTASVAAGEYDGAFTLTLADGRRATLSFALVVTG